MSARMADLATFATLGCLALGACGGGDDKPKAVQTIRVEDLSAGGCVTPVGDSHFVREFTPTPCEAAHPMEVAGTYALPDADYPGGADLKTRTYRDCQPTFEAYVGVSVFDSSRYDIRTIVPSPSTWARGDRTVICLVVGDAGDEGEPLVGAARGSGR